MADWFQVAWPKVDWHSLYSGGNQGGNSAPTVALSSPADNSSFAVNTSIALRANATDADGTIARVEFWVGNNRVATDNSAPYEFTWVPNATGSYSLTARATDNDGATSTSTARTISVTGAAQPQSSQSIVLKQGWNLVSSWVQPASPSLPAVFNSIKSEILLVKDEEGRQYHPPSGLNTIGNWSATAAYEVYANSPQTLDLSGYEVSSSQSISLVAGWNHLSFPRKAAIPITDALADVNGKVNIVKDVSGKVYYPAYSINEIGSLQPGQGYKIHMAANAELAYPSASGKGSESNSVKLISQASSALVIVESDGVADGTVVRAVAADGSVAGEGCCKRYGSCPPARRRPVHDSRS
ncbi:MAG: Ig-like domain-containing protein [Rhodothermales bacterium]